MTILLEDAQKKRKKDYCLFFALAIVTVLRLFLFGERGIMHTDSLHDDLLFLKQAYSIVHGNWLGEYNHMTLAKAPGYSFFCALCILTGLPYFLFLDLLLCFTAGISTLAVRPLLRSRIQIFFFYTFLIMNPFILFSQRLLIQDFFIIPFWLLVFSMGAVSLRLFRKDEERNHQLFWCSLLGIALFMCGLLREEGQLLLFLYLAFAVLMIFFLVYTKRKWKKPLLIFLLPFVIYGCGNLLISCINYNCYGYFGVCERRDRSYKKVMGTLLGVAKELDPSWDVRIPVKYDVLDKLYKLSPTLEPLSTKTNLSRGFFWNSWPNYRFPKEILKEKPQLAENIKGGFFQWAFLGALEEAGFYKDRKTLAAFYDQLNKELATLIASGKLPATHGVRTSSLPPFDPQIITFFFQKLKKELPKILFWRPVGLFHKIKYHPQPSDILDTKRLFSFMKESHSTRPEYPMIDIYGWGYSKKGSPISASDFQDLGGNVIFYPQHRSDVAEALAKEWNIPAENLPPMGFHILVRGIPRFCIRDPQTGAPLRHLNYDTWSRGYQDANCMINIDSRKELPPPPINQIPLIKRQLINKYIVFLTPISPYLFFCVILSFILCIDGILSGHRKRLSSVRKKYGLFLLLLFSGMAVFYFLTIIMANVYLHCPRFPHYYIPSSSIYWALIGLSLLFLLQEVEKLVLAVRRKGS